MSMLSGDVIDSSYPDLTVNATEDEISIYEKKKAAFASSFACLIGVIQILLGVFQFHRIVWYVIFISKIIWLLN